MKNLDYSEYAATQEKNRKKASEIMQRWVDANGVSDRQKVIEFAKALSDKYGEGAAAYACDMYDAVAKEQKAKVKQAIPADTASWEEVGRAINGSLKQSEDGKLISGVVERLVKQAGEDTMLRNAARDSAEFAWIPDGKACAYCLMIASKGWQRASKDLQNSHAEHIHANCGCEFAIRFDKETNIKGYDPAALKKIYDEAAPGYNSDVKLRELRKILENNKTKSKNTISKSLTLENFRMAAKNAGINDEVLKAIYSIIESKNATNKFDSIKVDNLGKKIIFDTIYIPNGTWYDAQLAINRDFFAGRTLEKINKAILDAPGTRCNNLNDAVTHEIYHALMVEKVTRSIIDEELNIGPGIDGISTTAYKDKLESISEIGVLKDRGEYDIVPIEGKELFEKYFEVE